METRTVTVTIEIEEGVSQDYLEGSLELHLLDWQDSGREIISVEENITKVKGLKPKNDTAFLMNLVESAERSDWA